MIKRKTTPRPAGYPMYRWFMHTADIRMRMHDALQMNYDSQGVIMLPLNTAANDKLLLHLTAWEIHTDPDTGAVVWVKRRTRDDWDDTTNYAWAFADFLRESGEMDRGTDQKPAETGPGLHGDQSGGVSEFGDMM